MTTNQPLHHHSLDLRGPLVQHSLESHKLCAAIHHP
uniref:CIPKW n=1 Tax=Arundo donax TaxID=35708 RepID=A0A0A9DTC0_ARUDO